MSQNKPETYSGNPLLKRANVKIDWTPERLDEWIKCSKDPVYFAKKYVKIVSLDEGLVPFKMYKFQENLIKKFHKNRFNICKMPRQCGKALDLNTPIPTPSGWTTMGDLKVGDLILSPDGNSTKVKFKTEVMYDHNCYKIYFDNGEEIVADAEHLWEVNSSYWRVGKKVLTTEEIFNAYLNKTNNKRGKGVQGAYYIDMPKPINEFNEEVLDIDPYLLGVWLGDGYSYDSRIISHRNDYDFYSNIIDISHSISVDNCYRFRPTGLYQKLKKENLLKNKHIPQKYLRASYQDRLELLRGLMDTDGSIKPNTRTFEFYQKNYDIILQVIELLASLGIKSRTRIKTIKNCLYYTITFTTEEEVFKLPRKVNLINKIRPTRIQDKRIYIQKIEKVASVPVACISVENDSKLFLCGKSFIPTHNTTTVVSYLIHYIIFNDNANIALLANKAQIAKDHLGRLQLAYENLPQWMQQGVKIWNKASLELDNGSKIIASSTSGSAIRGGSYNIIFLDEFAFIPNQIADEFFSSVYPTITSGKNTKVIMVSCVSKDTYLLTDSGYKKIEAFVDPIKDGAYQVPDYTIMGKDKFYTSDIIVNNKKSPTKIIKTRYETLECSQEHKLWAFDGEKYGFIESKALKVGDYVSIRYNQQIFGNQDFIGFNPEKGKSLNTFSCEYVNEDIAYFIGLYVSEGYARDIISKRTGNLIGGQVVITCGDDISQSLDKLNLTYNNPDNIHYVINSKDLVNFIKELGFDITNKAPQKVLPEKILSWSKNNITSLLRGMFDGDGGIDSKGRVKYTSTSRELIRQVQLLLANLGILGSVYKSTVGPSKKVKVSSTHYNIEIVGKYAFEYYNQIGFSLQRKQDRYNLLKPSNRLGSRTDIIPNSVLLFNEYNAPKFDERSRSKNTKSYSRALLLENKEILCSNEKVNQFFEDNISEHIIWLEIKEIQDGETEVYDVSLPDIENDKWAHSVLYNNFIGHQTPKGMNSFYKFWTDAIRGKNEYIPTEVHWSEVPGRNEKWKQQTIANTSQEQWEQEFESFLPETLINIKVDDKIVETTIGELYDELSNQGTN